MSRERAFIGRTEELKFLEGQFRRKEGSLVVLYGRRRLGKTALLRKFCEDKDCFFYSCSKDTDGSQLTKFSQALLEKTGGLKTNVKPVADWEKAFEALLDLPCESKSLIVIDEFQTICRTNPSIPSILQKLWDTTFQHKNIMIVLCGSSPKFIEDEILSYKNPLYGRATGILKLKPLPFSDVCQFLQNYSHRDKLITYAILGGVPYYLNAFDPDIPLKQNIKEQIMSPVGILNGEIDFLLSEEFKDVEIYKSIFQAFTSGSRTIGEITEKAYLENPERIESHLKALLDASLIEKECQINLVLEDDGNPNQAYYKISDHFFGFWFSFIAPNLNLINSVDKESVWLNNIEPNLNDFVSCIFKEICQNYLIKQQIKRKLPFRIRKIGRWIGTSSLRDHEHPKESRALTRDIDILACNLEETRFIVCACHFKNDLFAYSEFAQTKEKAIPFMSRDMVNFVLFSGSDFDEEIREESLTNPQLKLVTLEDIVNDL